MMVGRVARRWGCSSIFRGRWCGEARKEKRDAIAWSCLRVERGVACGAGMLLSDLRRGMDVLGMDVLATVGGEVGVDGPSVGISEEAIFWNSTAPGEELRSRIAMAEQTRRWLSRISLPSRSRSTLW